MALTAEQIQAQIDSLNEAIASGERQVTLGSQSITYRSISVLIAARDDRQRQLESVQAAGDTTKTPKRRTKLYYAGRGYC